MPSISHDTLVNFFRENPNLVATLMQDVLHLRLPAFTSIQLVGGDLSDLPAEFRADLVLLFWFGSKVVLAVVLEVQLGRDDRKPWVWPGYVGVARARYGCPASLVVVTLEEPVQRWASQTIVDDIPGGLALRPVALGPGSYPTLSAQEAAAEPELAMISVLSHAAAPDLVQVAEAALEGFIALPEDRRKLYYEIIFALFRQACRKGLLETQMLTQLMDKYRNEFRGFYDEGKADGEIKGKAEYVLEMLVARGIPVSDEARQRILSCPDVARLDQWFRRALRASTLEEVLA